VRTLIRRQCSYLLYAVSLITCRQCCGVGQYVDQASRETNTCAVCDTATVACATEGGATAQSLPLLSGLWRDSFDAANVRRCWNTDACVGGAPSVIITGADTATRSRDDYCAVGYVGPCK
jgi:hypothetical protein